MSSQPTETKELLADDVTKDQIDQLIAEKKAVGATSCEVVMEEGQRYLVCQWPPL